AGKSTEGLVMELASDAPRSFSLPTDLRSVMHAVLRKAWLIIAINVLALAGGILFIARSEKIFSATTTVEVEPEQQRIIRNDGHRPEEHGEEVLKTIEQNLSSSALMLRLARHPLLTRDQGFLGDVPATASDARLERVVASRINVRARPGT